MRGLQSGPVGAEDAGVGFGRLSAAVHAERAALDLVEYRLTCHYLLFASGPGRWAERANGELAEAVQAAESAGGERQQAVAELASQWSLPATVTLRELIDIAPPPWAEALCEHRSRLCDQVGRLQELNARARGMLGTRLVATRDALVCLGGGLDGYTANGGREALGGSLIVDATG